MPSSPQQPHAVYSLEALPPTVAMSLYLGGWRDGQAQPGWRHTALRLLSARGFDGVVLIPELRPAATAQPPTPAAKSDRNAASEGQLRTWEEGALSRCDIILLWLPKEAQSDFATIEEWGLLQRSGKVVLGTPERSGPLVDSATRRRIPVAHSLEELLALGLQLVRPGAVRRGNERVVPLSLWRSPSFQSWYRALTRAGHRLDDAEVEWTHRARGIGRPPFLWAVRPRVQVHGERRQLSGEVVIGRADVSAAVLYHREAHTPPLETLVVLVREFRAAVRNRSGFAWMLPGGSAARASERAHDARATAAQEVFEETGLKLPAEELFPLPLGDRQMLSSLSCHHAQLFRAALRKDQLAALQNTALLGQPLGATPSERCYVSLRRLGELFDDPDVDWSQLGMILYALSDKLGPL